MNFHALCMREVGIWSNSQKDHQGQLNLDYDIILDGRHPTSVSSQIESDTEALLSSCNCLTVETIGLLSSAACPNMPHRYQI
jgi:hypothetical protein